MKGPDYTVADLAFWGGMMAAFITTYLAIQAGLPEWPRLAHLGVAAVVGFGVGFATLKLYESIINPPGPPKDPDDNRFGR